jgi:hypothetical protein
MRKNVVSPHEQVRPVDTRARFAPAPDAVARAPAPLESAGVWALLATLGLLVALTVPELGSDAWPFHPASVRPHGVLSPLVRAAHERWDLGVVRTPAVFAGLLVAAAAAAALRVRAWRPRTAIALACTAIVLLLAPAVLLQVGLRQASAPWFHTNDSTYQIELAGDLIRHGHDPYGHDYSDSGLERWYPAAGFDPGRRQVALRHFAYFPGAALTAAAWGALPSPADDYRLFVLLTTFASFFAVLLFRAPLAWRLAAGAVVAANPLAIHAAWFGTADAPSILCLVLAFALVTRERYVAAAASIAVAVLLKQFALVALPFLAVMVLLRRAARETLWRAAAVFVGILAAGVLPFLVADPGAFWGDTISYGASTYRIIGYGLSGLLVRAHVIHDRFGHYPFALLALLVWLPVTAWLVWNQLRAGALWLGAAGFAVSMFVLLFVSRVFQNSYLVWPLTGIALAAVLAAGERRLSRAAP